MLIAIYGESKNYGINIVMKFLSDICNSLNEFMIDTQER